MTSAYFCPASFFSSLGRVLKRLETRQFWAELVLVLQKWPCLHQSVAKRPKIIFAPNSFLALRLTYLLTFLHGSLLSYRPLQVRQHCATSETGCTGKTSRKWPALCRVGRETGSNESRTSLQDRDRTRRRPEDDRQDCQSALCLTGHRAVRHDILATCWNLSCNSQQ